MKKIILSVLLPAIAFLGLLALPSCHKYSPDTPLPNIYTPSVFIGNNNQMVYSVDLKSGKVKWKTAVEGEVHATPVLFKGFLWVGTNQGILYKINYENGKIIDQRDFANGAIEGTPMPLENNYLLVPAGSTLHCVNPDSIPEDIWTYSAGGNINASPAIHVVPGLDTPVVFIASLNNKVTALNDEGSSLWTFSPAGGQGFYSSPCVSNDSFLYIGNDNGKVYAVNTQDGSEKWAFATQGMVESSPIQRGGNVLVGSNDRNLYSIDSATGLLRWKIQTGDQIVSSPAVANQYVYFGSYDGYIYCVDIIDGHIKWKKPTFGLINSSPTLYGGYLYIGSYDKNLYKLDTANGAQQWVRDIQGQIQASPIIDTIGGAVVPSISGSYKY